MRLDEIGFDQVRSGRLIRSCHSYVKVRSGQCDAKVKMSGQSYFNDGLNSNQGQPQIKLECWVLSG
jgi:hypothetical protein